MTEIDSYPIFEPNQVLNHTHLNGLRDYLEEQGRLTRSQLIGIGVVCGLEVSLKSKNHISLSKGCGITSKGFLLSFEDTLFTHYKTYKDPSGYQPFSGLSSEIYELLTKQENSAEALSSSGNFLNDKVVMAFVEYEDKRVDPCSIQDCDEHGTWRDFQLQCLLITKKDAMILLKGIHPDLKDAVTPSDMAAIINKKYLLDDVSIKRISCLAAGKGTSVEEAENFDELALLYIQAVIEALKPLMSAIENAYDTFSPILKASITSSDVETSMKRLHDLAVFMKKVAVEKDIPQMIQYYYDLVKDLIDAYTEFIGQAFDLMAECCPDGSLFPRHLFLGQAKPVADCRPSVFRHHFKQPPIYNGNALRLQEVTRLFYKILLMIENTTLLKDSGKDPSTEGVEIKTTPSIGPAQPLSERAIPYYYNVHDTQGSLFEYWSYDKYRRCKADSNLSYQSSGYSKKEFINNPLCYNLDSFSFFRIEGHMGKEAQEAFREIDSIRRSGNLPFQLVMLFDGDKSLYTSEESIGYEDLQTTYSIWRNKMLLLLNNFTLLISYLLKNLHVSSDKPLNDNFRKAGDDLFSSFSLAVLGSAGERIAAQPGYAKADKADIQKMDKAASYGIGRDVYFAKAALKETTRESAFTMGERLEAVSGESADYESRDDRFIRDTLDDLNQYVKGLINGLEPDLAEFQFNRFYENYSKCLYLNINICKYLADSHTGEEDAKKGASIFTIFCWVHRILSAIAIHPYIDIRILLDNIEQRKAVSSEAQNLFEFMKENTGLEHHAGVPKGGTFVLVYRPEESGGKIVADFSLPYIAYRKEEKRSAIADPIVPLVLPVCAVVEPVEEGEKKESAFPEVTIQLLDNLYDPKEFEPSLTSSPKFGEAVFKDAVYEPDQEKVKKILHYQANPELIKKAMERDKTRSVFVDEFKFMIRDVQGKTDAGKSTITVFILTQAAASQETAIVHGKVYGNTVYGRKFPVQSAIASDENNHTATTNKKGEYSLEVYVGVNRITISHPDFQLQTTSVEAKEAGKEHELNFELRIRDTSKSKEEKYREVNEALGISFGSAKADELAKAHEQRMKKYEEKIEAVKDDPDLGPDAPVYDTARSAKRFMEDEEINILTLNNEYSKKRDQLFESIQKSSGKEKVLQVEAYKTLTMVYIDRLALEQPKKFSSTTKAAMAKTTGQMKKEPDLNMEDEISEWSSEVDEKLPDSFISNVRKEMFQSS